MPSSVPLSVTKRRGAWFSRIATPSSSASSSSHGDALKWGRERRATTVISAPPSRRDVRQQSIAVLPTPMMRTRRPMRSTCPKCTEPSHSIPMCTRSVSQRPGTSSSFPFGAPLPTNTASQPPPRSVFMLATGESYRTSTPIATIASISSSSTAAGRRNEGMFTRISPPGCASASKIVHS